MLTSFAKWLLRGTGLLVLTPEEYSKAITEAGMVTARRSGYRPLTKEVAERIRRGCFIPRGEEVVTDTLEFFSTGPHEVHFCSEWVSNDPQSGPIYCGDIASKIAFTVQGNVVGLCGRHEHRHGKHLKAA